MSTDLGKIRSIGNNNHNNTGISNRTVICPDCTSKSWSWISKAILALGALLLIAGSITLAKGALPFSASVALIGLGSILIIAGLVKYVLLWIKGKFELSDNEVVGNSSYNNRVVNGSYHIANGSGITIVNGRVITPNNAKFIEGSGHITEKQSVLPAPITAIQVEGSAKLILSQGNSNSLSVSAEDNIMDLLEQKVDGNKLTLGCKPNVAFRTQSPIIYKLIVANPKELIVSGNTEVEIKELKGDTFTCNISGTSAVNIHAGEVKNQNINISGTGNYKAANLQSQAIQMTVSGTGDATVRASGSLNVSISGCGSCKYYGNPSISKSVKDAGSLNQLG